MGSITSFNRLEPRANDPTLGAIAARVGDPLWLLARQWQFREWQGTDSGSPAQIRLRYTIHPVTRYRPGPPVTAATGQRLGDSPWEALVEAEASGTSGDRRLATMAGQRFLDALGPMLAQRYRAAFVSRYPVAPLQTAEAAAADERSQRLVGLLAGRGLDGVALRDPLRAAVAAASLPPELGVDPADASAVLDAAAAWLTWCDGRFADPAADAWQGDALRYAFTVAAPTPGGEVVVAARDHQGGRVDWTAFELAVGASLGASLDATVAEQSVVALPTRLNFPGMPAPRWWQLEDGRVSLGNLEAAPDDISRLLLTELALVYGNDYFCLPLQVPVGSMCRITGLEVVTTFGEVVTIPDAVSADGAASPRWRMFQLGTGIPGDDRGAGWLIVPASTGDLQGSETLEEVLFSRDEMADIAWAVERRITGPAGVPVERREVFHRQQPVATPPSGQTTLRYQLASPVTPHWLPLVPAAAGPGRVRLQLSGPHQPLGRLLSSIGAPFALAAEELPRSGRLATRQNQRSRWVNGTTLVWTARRVESGRGESSAGLRFDDLTLTSGPA
jgi:hypothetical protein